MTLLLIAVGVAIIWMFLSSVVSELASDKGHSGTLWYLFSLVFTPLLGFLIVASLPSADELLPAEFRRCARCGGVSRVEESRCPFCHAMSPGRGPRERAAA
jgi:hypothetical protein